MLTDPIADFLTRIRNASIARLRVVNSPHSNMRFEIAEILKKEGYLSTVSVDTLPTNHKQLSVSLSYDGANLPKISHIRRISKPGQRVYVDKTAIPRPQRGLGCVILSTSSGVVTGKEAFKRGLGGEVICELW
ncbi:MAG: 30S ribosomal protein S8 [Patescibacteria group bacterium]|jgi:small subunit ribosomal protein S8